MELTELRLERLEKRAILLEEIVKAMANHLNKPIDKIYVPVLKSKAKVYILSDLLKTLEKEF